MRRLGLYPERRFTFWSSPEHTLWFNKLAVPGAVEECDLRPESAARCLPGPHPHARSRFPHDWLVYRLGGPKATFLGHVTAPNLEMALVVAYDEFNVTTPAEWERMIVRCTSGA